jgi:hypothetical protein
MTAAVVKCSSSGSTCIDLDIASGTVSGVMRSLEFKTLLAPRCALIQLSGNASELVSGKVPPEFSGKLFTQHHADIGTFNSVQ